MHASNLDGNLMDAKEQRRKTDKERYVPMTNKEKLKKTKKMFEDYQLQNVRRNMQTWSQHRR